MVLATTKERRFRWVTGAAVGVGAGLLASICTLGGRTPLATGLVASCKKPGERWAALAGAVAGCFLLQSFGSAVRCSGILIISAVLLSAFPWSHPLAAPLTAAGATLAGELAYIAPLGFTGEGLLGLLSSTVLAGVSCRYWSFLRSGGSPRRQKKDTFRQRLKLGAEALRSLGESIGAPVEAREENPAVVFDRAAEVVCRGCALRDVCWNKEYVSTFNAFNDATPALLERGSAEAGDFAPYFASRCIHFPQLLTAISTETKALLLRRQYRRELDRERRRTRGQYGLLTELVAQTMAAPDRDSTPEACRAAYRVAMASRPKEGQRVCGDSLTYFQCGDQLFLLLSDGMGFGLEAQRESRMAIRLLEQFLRAGIHPEPALRTMNAALNVRSDDQGSFTTIDLLALDLGSREASLYKYGAAPTYIKRSGLVRRLTASSLPAGLADAASAPEPACFSLEAGSFLVMVSDGVADSLSDEWLQDLLAGWQGEDPDDLTALILRECGCRRGDDDVSVLCLTLSGRGKG